jgi:hypothetical protein
MTDQPAGGVDKNGEGPGVSRVGRVGIAVVTAYLLGLSAALLYCLIILCFSGCTLRNNSLPESH